MDLLSSKHRELSEQLAKWWAGQTDFKTKKALAGQLEIHPDTLGDYFSGRKFPQSDIASRLGHITKVSCLNYATTLGVAIPDVSGQQLGREVTKKVQRQGHEAVVISLQRTQCPFCRYPIERFQGCVCCGQHFVWANVPIGQDNASEHDDLSAQPTPSGNSG